VRAVIVGGGIGGLAAAMALHRRGVDVEVLERTPGPTPALVTVNELHEKHCGRSSSAATKPKPP
jgi:2-polyprenyl-6-methoxyphenol hydroxylase-like FAD-dependent oxidoreductase